MRGTRTHRARVGAAQRTVVWLVVAAVGAGMQRLPVVTPGVYWPWVLGASSVGVVVEFVVWRRRFSGSAGAVSRWSRRSTRNQGVASRWAILRTASGFAMRRKATILRPSLRRLSWWTRRRVALTEYATRLARVGWLGVWSPCEDVTLGVGGPRTGKTGELACRILDAPGAVITTSTRTDLVELTGPCRRKLGPLYVFNPSGLGRLASTVVFDPLAGCAVPKAATERAADLLAGVSGPGGDTGDREFWTAQARRVLALLLHAAALGGAGMRDVLAWVSDPTDAAGDVQRFLRRSVSSAFEADAAQFLATNDRTRSSITSTIMPALGWLVDATAAAAAGVDQTRDAEPFDVAQLLEQRGTVYLLGAEDAMTAPLVTALTGYLAREARRIAAEAPAGRLEPALTMGLDEAAIICPIPLDAWTADMGGRNITIHIRVQSRAQLRQRWGEVGAAAILNNAATILIFGGTRDPDDLNAYATLTGERDEEVPTLDLDGRVASTTTRRVPVLSAAQIAQLPAGRVLIIRRGMPPAIGRVQMAWKRREVRAVARAERRLARATRVQARLASAGSAAGRLAGQANDTLAGRYPSVASRLADAVTTVREAVRGPDPETFRTRFVDTTWVATDLDGDGFPDGWTDPHTDGPGGPGGPGGLDGGWS